MKNEMIITANGVVTPKDWTVNANARHDYTHVADIRYNEWLASQSK